MAILDLESQSFHFSGIDLENTHYAWSAPRTTYSFLLLLIFRLNDFELAVKTRVWKSSSSQSLMRSKGKMLIQEKLTTPCLPRKLDEAETRPIGFGCTHRLATNAMPLI